MKKLFKLILLATSLPCFAQDPFIKTTDFVNGASSRIVPDGSNGWVIFSSDSLRITKYNNCGFLEWGKKYQAPGVFYHLFDFIRLTNGDYAYMTRMEKGNATISTVSRIDPSGNIIWSKSYGDADYHHYTYSLIEDLSGNLYIYCNVTYHQVNPIYNALMKLDAAGNLLWTKFYDHGWVWGGAIITSDNGILMRTGLRFIKTDINGNVQWSTDIGANTYHFLAAIEVSDGYIFTGYTNPGNKVSFYKMDKSGNQLWGGGKQLDIEGVPPRMRKTPSGNIVGIFRKSWNSVLYTTIIEFDKDLNIVKENSLDNSSILNGTEICFLNDGTSVITGPDASGNTFFAHLDTDYKSKCDILLPPAIVSPLPVAMAFVPTVMTTFTFNTNTENYTADTFSVVITTYCIPPKILELGNDTSVCGGNPLTLYNHSADVFDDYIWSTGQTSATITVNSSGLYHLTVKDDCGEVALYDSVMIEILEPATADAGPDLAFCDDDHVVLQVSSCDSCTYLWNNGSTSDTAYIETPGIYIVTVTNSNSCFDSDTITTEQSKCECNIYLPKAFTPNNDAINENFGAYYYCDLADYQLTIFNRWGQKIFTTDNPETFWNGRYNNSDAPLDVYVYRLEYTSIIKGEKSKPERKSGTFNLLR